MPLAKLSLNNPLQKQQTKEAHKEILWMMDHLPLGIKIKPHPTHRLSAGPTTLLLPPRSKGKGKESLVLLPQRVQISQSSQKEAHANLRVYFRTRRSQES